MQVLGGADLFLQGLIVSDQGLGTFATGDLMLASIPQNQYPFAIGVMETSSADITKNGLKGKGLKLLHHYPDMLWALGDKSVPDPSFTATRIFPQASIAQLPRNQWLNSCIKPLVYWSSNVQKVKLPTLTNSQLPVGFLQQSC